MSQDPKKSTRLQVFDALATGKPIIEIEAWLTHRAPLYPHLEEACLVCQSEIWKGNIERGYQNWYSNEDLEKRYDIPAAVIEDHCKAYGLDHERTKDTSAVSRAVLRTTLGYYMENPNKVPPAVILGFAAQRDKIEGKEQRARLNDKDLDAQKQAIREGVEQCIKDGISKKQIAEIYGDQGIDVKEFIS